MELAKVVPVELHLTSIDNLMVRDPTTERIEEMNEIEDDIEKAVYMFTHFVCDPEGQAFDELLTAEGVKKTGLLRIRKIMNAVNEVINEPGKD